MKNKAEILIVILFLALIVNCSNKETKLIKDKGFIIFIDPQHWIFIPANSINSKNCIGDFETGNLKIGLGFPLESTVNISYIKRTLDSLRIENTSPGARSGMDQLKITPVDIEYEIAEKYIGIESQLRSKFDLKIKGRSVEIIYDQFPIRINKMTPLFCLNKKQADIKECECKHRTDDPDDYLFKICNYLKEQDKYSDLPDKYNIKKVEEDSLSNKAVIKVELTCCYLGDIAYFDPGTKQLISISYGPE